MFVKKETVNTNKKIAEFMDCVVYDKHPNGSATYNLIGELANANNDYTCYEKYLKFHESWDWIVPVIQKITNLVYLEFQSPTNRSFEIVEEIEEKLLRFDINGIYKLVIEFIDLYNNCKTQNIY